MQANSFRLNLSTLVVVHLMLCFSGLLQGQTGTNTGLSGHVSDSAGSAVPGAVVELTNTETAESRSTATASDGAWEARSLSPGQYRLTVEKSGFKRLVRTGIRVSSFEMATVDLSLELGELQQTVEVEGDAEMVRSDSATIVRTLDQEELERLPTSARNFTQMLVIKAGVSADISELLSNNNASISPSVNGARTTNNSFVFNGVDVTNLLCCNSRINGSRGTIDQGGGSLSRNIAPAPETLQEVKLQTSLYDAATGRNGGGAFSLVSKSGTNELHGSAYYYGQNEALIANDFFFNKNGLDRQKLKRHEYGFSVGGPVFLPKFYDGRNKTFVFGSYQRTDATTAYVPEASTIRRLPQALTDDRSTAGIRNFAESIWNVDEMGPFNPNVFNSTSVQLLQAKFPNGQYLIPSGSSGRNCEQESLGVSCDVINVAPATFVQDQFSANLDQQFGGNNRFSGKFFFTNQPSVDPFADSEAVSLFRREENTAQRTVALTDNHIFGPTLVNEFRFGFFRNRNDTAAVPFFTNAEFGINNPLAAERPDLAQIEIAGDEDIGDAFVFGTPPDDTLDKQETFTFGNTLSWIAGKHSIRMGGEFRRHRLYGDLRENKHGDIGAQSWNEFLTVGYANPEDGGRSRQLDISLNYGETERDFRMWDWSWFVADDWRVTRNLTFNLGVRHEFFGWPSEKNGIHNTYDYNVALASQQAGGPSVQDGFLFASNFNPATLAGTQGLSLRFADTKYIFPKDNNNLMPRFGFAYTPTANANLVLRGGYGIYFSRVTGAFINSLRQGAPFFREAENDDRGDWNAFPTDVAIFPVPQFQVGFDDGEPFLEGADNPGEEFEALENQMVSPDQATPYLQQWNFNVQWGFAKDWLFDIGYVGSKGTKLNQIRNLSQAIDVDRNGGFLARPGVPGGGFIGNYFTVVDDEFVNLVNPPDDCDITDDPGDCVIPNELRGRVLGFDEDEGANTLFSDANSIYHSLQTSLEKRFSAGLLFNANYTFSRSIDTFSDEGQYQVEHDQTNPRNNRGLSDFHRKHRFVFSFSYDLPFRGNVLLSGWSISGIGTFQSGRPFTVFDEDLSGFLYASTKPRPNLAEGSTYADQLTSGSTSSRVDGFLNESAFVSSGAQFGNLGRNSVIGPTQRRLDLSLMKLTRLSEQISMELRGEFYNATNTPNFRDPISNLSDGSFGRIQEMRGGPRVIQVGAKLRW